MHGYPIYADWSDGPTDEHLVPFLALITGWLAGGAPVLFEEFGLPTVPAAGSASAMLVDETDAAAYTAAVLDELWNVGALGALLWCASDYASALHDHPPFDQAVHERTFGLWRADGSAKPAVAELAQPWIDIDAAEFALHPKEQLGRLYRRYRQMGLR
jgi:endo-1,4-beta-mannosidase